MTTATSDAATLDADEYLKAVAPHLAALPADERTELLDDLAQHLREIAAEPGPPLAERLGPPAAYAAELLASAGVAPVADGRSALFERAAATLRRARASAAGREAVRLWPVLQPAWWVVRAYLAVSLLAATGRSGPSRVTFLPRLAGNPALGLLAVLVAIAVSVRLGQRRPSPVGRVAVGVVNVVLVVYAISLLGRPVGGIEVRRVDAFGPVAPKGQACLLDGSGQPITNLYAYDAGGHLLDPVLLYDQNGQPVDNLCTGFDGSGRRVSADYPQDVNGAPVLNAFPQHQSEVDLLPPGLKTPSPARPQPGQATAVKPPAVVVPRLAPTTTATTTATG